PLDKWYKEELKGLAEQLFTSAAVRERGIYNYDYLKDIWEKYPRSPLLYGKQLFTVINLELWQRQFLDQDKLKPMELKHLL
ncbi:MAG: asparagine synthase-related protein, partial [Nanoarchaeota archaeon]|nr:asparagine synthase-related protein [Nanoarchaeota archaeon]